VVTDHFQLVKSAKDVGEKQHKLVNTVTGQEKSPLLDKSKITHFKGSILTAGVSDYLL